MSFYSVSHASASVPASMNFVDPFSSFSTMPESNSRCAGEMLSAYLATEQAEFKWAEELKKLSKEDRALYANYVRDVTQEIFNTLATMELRGIACDELAAQASRSFQYLKSSMQAIIRENQQADAMAHETTQKCNRLDDKIKATQLPTQSLISPSSIGTIAGSATGNMAGAALYKKILEKQSTKATMKAIKAAKDTSDFAEAFAESTKLYKEAESYAKALKGARSGVSSSIQKRVSTLKKEMGQAAETNGVIDYNKVKEMMQEAISRAEGLANELKVDFASNVMTERKFQAAERSASAKAAQASAVAAAARSGSGLGVARVAGAVICSIFGRSLGLFTELLLNSTEAY